MYTQLEKTINELRNELSFTNKMYCSLKEQLDSMVQHKESLEKKIKELTDNATKEFIDEFKQKYSADTILLFRCGDFYECYGEDAVEISVTLGITLNMDKTDKGIRSCVTGFPHHALDTYLPKLIRAGKRVAIADEIKVY